jgi:exopolysaccharide biosynthesis polyprenyl glycosylphosphotransferase
MQSAAQSVPQGADSGPGAVLGAPVKEIDRYEGTAATAVLSPPNFAVLAELPALSRRPPALGLRGPRTITGGELTLVRICTDFLCVCAALPLGILLLSQLSSAPANSLSLFTTNAALNSFFPVAVVLALALGGTYRVSHHSLQPSALLEVRDLCFSVGAGCVLALAVGAVWHAALGPSEPNSTQLVVAAIVAVAVISLGRIVMRMALHVLTTSRVLVIGAGKMADRVMMSVRQDAGMTLLGRVADSDAYDPGAVGRVSDLPRLCRELHVDRILVASPRRITSDGLAAYRQLQDSVHIAMVPQYHELVSWRSRMTDLAGMPFLEIARPHLSRWDQMMKRFFDLSTSAAVLLLTTPVMVAVAIGVKLSSPGPVFFRQVRLGRDRAPFTITKFRTMTVVPETDELGSETGEAGDEECPLHELHGKLGERDRITRFGAFLRRSGLDEIPQFFNVFRGDMSVVGPRPFIPAESGVAGWGTRRFDVRPGITGLWQVSGRNDLSRSDLVQLDYLYVASWSLWWDLKIMWDTPRTMAQGRGAY